MDMVIHAGQRGDYLDIHTSTFWTTRMATLLLIDDEPKLIFKQVSHVFAPQGFQIELVRSRSEAIRHISEGMGWEAIFDGRAGHCLLCRSFVYQNIGIPSQC